MGYDMNWTLLAIRAVLSVVFIIAGVAKLLDLRGSQKALKDFGLPPGTAERLGVACQWPRSWLPSYSSHCDQPGWEQQERWLSC